MPVLDGYIRVSQVAGREGESFISPKVQREMIERWIAGQGAVLGRFLEELDASGARSDRPLLMEAIRRVERGESQGIVVAKLDRFGRKVLDGLLAIGRIRDAGGTFVSVQDGFDIRTRTGRLLYQNLLAIAEWFWEGKREDYEQARSRAITRGVYIARKGPIGLLRAEDKRLRIDPIKGPTIHEVFERRSRGDSYQELADFLNDTGIGTEKGVAFTCDSIRRILTNPAYMGVAHSGRYQNANAHPALVPPELWHECQSQPRRPRERVEVLLSGLVYCGGCNGSMTALRPRGKRPRWPHTVLRCHAGLSTCPSPAIARADELEPLVEDFIFRRLEGRKPQSGDERALTRCKVSVKAAEEDLAAYRDMPNLVGRLGPASFEAGIDKRQKVLERRFLELAKAKQAVGNPRIDIADLDTRWTLLSWQGRRAAARELIDCIVVHRGTAPLTDRARIYRRGRGPIVSNQEANDQKTSRPKADRWSRFKLWPEKRIEAELREFVADQSRWPTYLEFAAAGLARLHAQAWAWGGPYYWSQKLDLEVPKGFVQWTDARVGDALKPFVRGRTDWPTKSEFDDAGLGQLHRACGHHGGMLHWAEHFGLNYAARKNDRWNKDLIERDFLANLDGFNRFPKKAEFIAAGQMKLYSAMHSHGGLSYWAERLCLERAAGWLEFRDSEVRQVNGGRGVAKENAKKASGAVRQP
jgi:site-specific DNA recombinase